MRVRLAACAVLLLAAPAAAEPVACPSDELAFDALFLQRTNASGGQPLALLADGPGAGSTVLNNRSMVPAVAPGARLFYRHRGPDHGGWEAGYWGVYGFFGDARADLPDNLSIPGTLGANVAGWDTADSVVAGYRSSLNVAEVSGLLTSCATGCDPGSRWPMRRVGYDMSFDWIGGLFWAGLDEESSLAVRIDPGEPTSSYRVTAGSQLVGAQVGGQGRVARGRWALEGRAKVGLGGSWLEQSAQPITSPLAPGVEYRPGREASTTGLGFLSTLGTTVVYRLNDSWGLRAGYDLAWLEGLALAPDQFDFTDTTDSGTRVQKGGGLYLHGASLGLEARW